MNQKPGKGRAKHRCSVTPDPYKGWALPMDQWRKDFEEYYANRQPRRPVRKG